MLNITMAACTDRGQRSTNEDALRLGSAGATHYAVLSDGAGGHENGAEAARRVVDHIEAALVADAIAFAPERLTEALLGAHADLQRRQQGARGKQRMHATIVTLWIDTRHDQAVWSHTGDSRLYRLRYGATERLTSDDSIVQQMLDGGLLTAEQARHHPAKNQLLAAVGMQDDIEPHTSEKAAPLEDGDAWLLCTDGWWDGLEEAELAATLLQATSPQEWLDTMRTMISARADARQDNFSAIAVWVRDPDQETVPMEEDEDNETTVALASPTAG
jgi:serine/threonine protein phosphatase PrpC